MIQEEFKELALQVKEMLSSDSGFVKESVAPMIGGGFTGDLMPVGYAVFPVRQICKTDLGKTLMDSVTMFYQKVIDIDDENDMVVYSEASLLSEETIRILEVWMQRFIEEKLDEL
tara:strand:- start:115 stop:459 length:345 start_codon:yes stop_codon:yes gene_type:complete